MALDKHIDPQLKLINSLEGIHLVDAGAGTGKTYSIVRRYENIIDGGSKPEDILLVTFTVKAAEQMRDDIINNLSHKVSISKLLEAPVMTFHAFCSRILKKAGTASPTYLGLNEYLPKNFNILEDSFEKEIFRKFFLSFSKLNSEKYSQILYALENEDATILKIIKKLCSVGIFPTVNGWVEKDLERLSGNYEAYNESFDKLNEIVIGKNKPEGIQNELYKRFSQITINKLYTDYNRNNIFKDKIMINPAIKEDLFNDTMQKDYIEFIKDVYISYISYLLKRNLINYEFMTMFAYLVLYNNGGLRKNTRFEYVMIDEFQDTDELQFKLIMLVCKNVKGKANLCVVGDWKQGIYGFRNTKIENITEFAKNLQHNKKELNRVEVRVDYDVGEHSKIIFETNYRSSESILKFSRETLFVKGSDKEEVDRGIIENNFKESLRPNRELEDLTEIKFYKAKNRLDEYDLVLKKISELVNETDKYKIRDFDKITGKVIEDRPVRYKDICVLSRVKRFCLELKREGTRKGIPINYGGGLEIFASEQGILVLAWLKLMINEKDLSGWLPVLDIEGYTYPEIKYFRDNIVENSYRLFAGMPDDLSDFLSRLRSNKNNILYAVESILGRYKFNDEKGNKIMTIIHKWMNSDLISLNDLVNIIDNSAKAEFDIEPENSSDAVLTQTIHRSKGMEYPIVIVANMNQLCFPGNTGDSSRIVYNDIAGLRAKNFFATKGVYYYKFHNWRTDLLNALCRKSDYDEERRLLYVAVTRAKQYVYLTSFKPSPFFKELSALTEKEVITDFDHKIIGHKSENNFSDEEILLTDPVIKQRKFVSTHRLMDEADMDFGNFEPNDENDLRTVKERLDHGALVHNLAHKIAGGIEVESDLPELIKIKTFLEDLKANELKSETDFILPKDDQIIRGTIDLLAFYDDRIEVIDYKTDTNKNYIQKYKIQIDVYKDVVKSIYKDKKVSGKIYFIELDEIVLVE
ncbi:MAG: UvrD-helicase domain-containing protein [Ignavibacteria bacterium]